MKNLILVAFLGIVFTHKAAAAIALLKTDADSCAQIVLKSGDIIQAKILHVNVENFLSPPFSAPSYFITPKKG